MFRGQLTTLSWGQLFSVQATSPQQNLARSSTLVFLHSVLQSHLSLRQVMSAVTENSQTTAWAFDLPGCGESDRPEPREFQCYNLRHVAQELSFALTAHRLKRVHLVGHGLGATLALLIAAASPDQVLSVVALNPFAICAPPFVKAWRPWLHLDSLALSLVLHKRAFWRHLAALHSAPELLDRDLAEVYWDRLNRPGGRKAAFWLIKQLLSVQRISGALPQVRAKTLIVTGDRDAQAPPSVMGELVDRLPNARLAVLEGCGHLSPLEYPEELARLILTHTT